MIAAMDELISIPMDMCGSDTGSLISNTNSINSISTDATTPPPSESLLLLPHLSHSSNSHSISGSNIIANIEEGGDSAEDGAGPQKKKRKKRQTGVFKCDYQDCPKSFTRAEHLSRHKLNHNPTVIYKCPWPNCDKSFVRSDLKERHLKRHELRKIKDEAKLLNQALNGKRTRRKKTLSAAAAPTQTSNNNSSTNNSKGTTPSSLSKMDIDSLILSKEAEASGLPSHQQLQQHQQQQQRINKNLLNGRDVNNISSPSHLISWLFEENQSQNNPPTTTMTTTAGAAHIDQTPTLTDMPSQSAEDSLQEVIVNGPMTVMNDPFHSSLSANNNNNNSLMSGGNNFFNHDDVDPFNELSSTLINELLTIPENYFPNPIQQTSVTPEIVATLIQLVPSIANHEYLSDLGHFLELYWKCFHLQYPILHKPSFNTFTCPPILLLSMIMTGASYAMSEPDLNPKYNIKNPREFADMIALPLRFIIFGSEEFQAPAPVYIIQSLLLLECYERLSTNRVLHERAYVHHGTTIQLLRRAPGLGGNPLKNKVDYAKNIEHSSTIWEKWIDFEMLKRVALFAFYIDSVHSSVFGYHFILNTHQIQLDLPCDEELWESYLNSEELPQKSDSIPFLIGLKKILNNEYVKTSRFGKKILLSGLLTIMFQLQQDEIQGVYLDLNKPGNSNWKEKLSLAFDFWNCEILQNSCHTDNHIYNPTNDTTSLPLTLQNQDFRCKYPVYHIAQITLRIQHYDYYIFAGAPWRMNVKAESADYELVEKKIMEWSNSQEGAITVVYAYMFLFEMFLKPQDISTTTTSTTSTGSCVDYSLYSGNNEAIYNRLNVLALVGLLIWGYSFSLYGAESVQYNDDELHIDEYDYVDQLTLKEDGIEYLTRIRDEMTKLIGEKVQVCASLNYVEFHNKIKKIATRLNKVQNLHHTTGVLKIMAFKIFKNCYWEVGREFSRLTLNCCKRSLGSKKVRCDDMYKTNYVSGL